LSFVISVADAFSSSSILYVAAECERICVGTDDVFRRRQVAYCPLRWTITIKAYPEGTSAWMNSNATLIVTSSTWTRSANALLSQGEHKAPRGNASNRGIVPTSGCCNARKREAYATKLNVFKWL
jgi:hypothetical protein